MNVKGAVAPPGDAVRMELVMMIGVLPFAFADIRLPVPPTLWSTDASSKGGGIVRAEVTRNELIELLAAAQTRGGSPFLATGDIRFLKVPEVCVDASALAWQNVLAVVWSQAKHINILEAQAVLLLLRLLGREQPFWRKRFFFVS